MNKSDLDKSDLEINLVNQSTATTQSALPTKSCSLNALNTELSTSSSSKSTQSSSPPVASSPDSVKAKLNGLLMLSKKASTNSLDSSSNASLEQVDPSFLSLISSSSIILTPSPSPTPGNSLSFFF